MVRCQRAADITGPPRFIHTNTIGTMGVIGSGGVSVFLSTGTRLIPQVPTLLAVWTARYWSTMLSHKLELVTAHDIWPNKAVIPPNVPQCDDFLRP